MYSYTHTHKYYINEVKEYTIFVMEHREIYYFIYYTKHSLNLENKYFDYILYNYINNLGGQKL